MHVDLRTAPMKQRATRRAGASETAKVRIAPSFDRCFFRAVGMIRKVTERLEELSLRLVVVRLARARTCQVRLYLPRRHAVQNAFSLSPLPLLVGKQNNQQNCN